MPVENTRCQTHPNTKISAGQLDMEVPDHESDMEEGTYRLIQPLNQPGWTTWYSVHSDKLYLWHSWRIQADKQRVTHTHTHTHI